MLAQENDTLQSQGKAETVGGPAPQDLGQPVVAPAAHQGILGAQSRAGDLKGGAAVVVQPPHQPGHDLEPDVAALEMSQELIEVQAAGLAQTLQDRGKRLDDRLAGPVLAVQHPQRIGLAAPAAVGAESVLFISQRRLQFPHKPGSASAAADGIHQQFGLPHADPVQEQLQQLDHFRFDGRMIRAQHLGSQLVELPEASLLRPFPPEHGPQVVDLPDLRVPMDLVFQIGPNHRRRPLGTQGERAAVTVVEGVHFLGDDIGIFAHSPGKQLGAFEDRGADFGEAVDREDLPGGLLHPIPYRRFLRQNVSSPLDGLDHESSIGQARSGVLQPNGDLGGNPSMETKTEPPGRNAASPAA